MSVKQVCEGVFFVGVQDWNRRLFDELIPLPNGTSYNAYLLRGRDKVVLIDTVDPSKVGLLLANIDKLRIEKIDYIVSNHAEQDHSGGIPAVLSRFPDASIVTNPKCRQMLQELLHLPKDKFVEVADKDRLDIGGMTLEFIYLPWVHWPETMGTYLWEHKVLFSCDFFGSHRATANLFARDRCQLVLDAKRYYAEIMMPFRTQIRKNIQKLSDYDISIIAPSHGPLPSNPNWVIEAYKEWVSDEVKKKVLLPYVSMHNSSLEITDYITDVFIEMDIEVLPINLTGVDIGNFAMELVDAAAVVFVGPYVLTGLHPTLVSAIYLMRALRPKTKVVSAVFSYGWGGIGDKLFMDLTSGIGAKVVEPILIKGKPTQAVLQRLKDEYIGPILSEI